MNLKALPQPLGAFAGGTCVCTLPPLFAGCAGRTGVLACARAVIYFLMKDSP